MNRVAIIDYGMGNLRSVQKAFEHVGASVEIVCDPVRLASADRIVFPGVGSFAECSRRMRGLGFFEALRTSDRPLLGICLGMQGLVDGGDEGGESPGLGLIPGRVERFDGTKIGGLKIPHIGWNEVRAEIEHPLLRGISSADCFYFVHSYYVNAPGNVAATTEYGVPFCSAIAKDHVFGIQCHPEKSQAPGLKLLLNFLAWSP